MCRHGDVSIMLAIYVRVRFLVRFTPYLFVIMIFMSDELLPKVLRAFSNQLGCQHTPKILYTVL